MVFNQRLRHASALRKTVGIPITVFTMLESKLASFSFFGVGGHVVHAPRILNGIIDALEAANFAT